MEEKEKITEKKILKSDYNKTEVKKLIIVHF